MESRLLSAPIGAFVRGLVQNEEKVLLGVLMSFLLFIDWTQTMTIALNPKLWYEINPILGKHPSTAFVTMYFIVVEILAIIFLSIKHRLIVPVFCVMTIIQAFFVGRNVFIGL